MYDEYNSLGRHLLALDLGDYLEFGCGDGTFLKYVLSQNTSFNSITAVDINPASVEKSRETLADWDIQYIVQEKLPLPLEADRLSTITLSNTLHHLQDKPGVLHELKRLIGSNGRIIITEMISNDLSKPEETYCRFHALRAATDRLKGVYHDTTYTSDEILEVVIGAGLTVDKKDILLNDKTAVKDEFERSRIETTIDDMLGSVEDRPEYLKLEKTARSVKEQLGQVGIKRPRQLYLETTL